MRIRREIASFVTLVFLLLPRPVAEAVEFQTLYKFGNDGSGVYPQGRLVEGGDGNFYGTTFLGGTNGFGSVFRLSPAGALNTIHSFNNTDGSSPEAGLTKGGDGNFYGTTTQGGAFGRGTVFRVTPAGQLVTLHSFNGADGSIPGAELVLGADGNFYGTTRGGFGGTVFRITSAGSLTTLWRFAENESQGGAPDCLVYATDGNVYGVTRRGGTGLRGTVFKLTLQAPIVLTTLREFDGGADGGEPIRLIQASDGHFYGTTITGGTGRGTIFKITSSGVFTKLHDLSLGEGDAPAGALLEDSDGSFYGTARGGGTSNRGTIFKVTTQGSLTVIHSFANDEGRTPEAGVIRGSDGRLYGTTQYGGLDPEDSGTAFAIALASPRPPVANISTRLEVESGDDLGRIMIAGFIVQGPPGATKKVLVRALGPSLAELGIAGPLANPVVALYDAAGESLAGNDNWKDSQRAEIEATTIAPRHDLEAAIVATLPSGAYTALLSGVDDSKGVALVEVYDLALSSPARLANISTRGYVQTGENVMIGGFIVGSGGGGAARVVVRGIGPSLVNSGLANALEDTTLELRNSSGALLAANDDWKQTQRAAIEQTGIPPSDDRESAIVAELPSGPYTVILRGKNDTLGVGLVELYALP